MIVERGRRLAYENHASLVIWNSVKL